MSRPGNLFTTRGALKPSHALVRGCAEALEWAQGACLNVHDSFLLVYGGPQYGKTSFLSRLAHSLRHADGVYVCWKDVQELTGASAHEVYRDLVRSIAERLPQVQSPPPDAPDAAALRRFLEQRLAGDNVKRLVLLLDNAAALPEPARKEFAAVLCALHARRVENAALEKVQVVLAGGLDLFRLATDEAPNLERICEDVRLVDLGEPDAHTLVADGLAAAGVETSHAIQLAQQVYTCVCGHPYLTQRLGWLLADAHLRGTTPEEASVAELAQEILATRDALLAALRRSMQEPALEDAARRLLTGTYPANRHNDAMERLELLGLARREKPAWRPRSPLLAVALAQWLGFELPAGLSLLQAADEAGRVARRQAAAGAPGSQASLADLEWERGYLTSFTVDIEHLNAAVPWVRGSFRLSDVYTELPLHGPLAPSSQPSAAQHPIRCADLVALPRVAGAGRPAGLVALTGDAGSGKSTLLRYLAWWAAQRRHQTLEAGGDVDQMLPVFIDLARARREGSPANGQELSPDQDAWHTLVAARLHRSVEQTRALLREGGVVVLVDGLDEVADRGRVVAGLARFQRAYSPLRAPNRVVVACRHAAWDATGAAGEFEQIALQEMDDATLEAYLTAWCRAVWGEAAPTVSRHLQNTLRKSPGLKQVARTPQMAAMLACLKHEEELPNQRALLYKRFIERLNRGPKAYLSHLVVLALAMQLAQRTDGERRNAMGYRDAIALLDTCSGSSGAALLRDLTIRTGLLDVDEQREQSETNRFVRFKHRTFQEYLAAYHYFDQPDTEDRARLLAHVDEPAWDEVLAFCCGLLAEYKPADMGDLLERLLLPQGAPGADRARSAAAASVCVTELASYQLDGAARAPVDTAREAISRPLTEHDNTVDLKTRLLIAEALGAKRAEGLSANYDPRLQREPRWVHVPGGRFTRGSAADDAWPQEGPPARVTVGEFWIQRWPVTVAEFWEFLDAPDGYQDDRWWGDDGGLDWRAAQTRHGPKGWEQISGVVNRPVSGVCWWEARAYCRWYTSLAATRSGAHGIPDGYVVLLPTEAQWEYAAHPGPLDDAELVRAALYPWGKKWEAGAANDAASGLPNPGPTPVGLFWAGHNLRFDRELWDLAGNVSEYCRDGFAPYRAGETTDPLYDKDYRHGAVIRGGSYSSSGLDVRITARFGVGRGEQLETAGFRCVAVPRVGGVEGSV